MIKILVIEDDWDLNKAVRLHLNSRGFYTNGISSGAEAFDELYSNHYDLIISDIMMPKVDGFELAKMIRAQDKNIPILFMTARDDFVSKEKGYMIGIDDYMVKPIDLNELVLHINALMRRANIVSEKKIVVGNLTLDEEATTTTLNGTAVELTLREFQILFKLLSYPNHTFTRSQLMDEFSGIENESGLRTVDVHITNIRNKIFGSDSVEIKTVRGLGYKAVIL